VLGYVVNEWSCERDRDASAVVKVHGGPRKCCAEGVVRLVAMLSYVWLCGIVSCAVIWVLPVESVCE
jgi:hypothetical protein